MADKPQLRIRQSSLFAPTRVEIVYGGAIIDVSHLVREVRWQRTATDVPFCSIELSPTAADDVELWGRLDMLGIERPEVPGA